MSQLIVTEAAAAGIGRCRAFLAEKDERASIKVGREIAARLRTLERRPGIGRPFAPDSDLRELVIGVGRSGYLCLYRYDEGRDLVVVLAFRHQREAGY